MMPSPMLELNAISRTYTSGGQPLTVLRDVKLVIHSGEFVAIILFGYLPARKAARLDPIDALARD